MKERVASTGPESVIGRKRQDLYAKTLKRVSESIEAGFVLEAITLLESVMSDRLEARLANLGLECDGTGKFWSLTKMADTLAKQSHETDDAKKVYLKIRIWAKKRNAALHGLGKLAKAEVKGWDQKYNEARAAADNGLELFRDLDREVKKLNRHRPST